MMPTGDPERTEIVLDADTADVGRAEDRGLAARHAISDILALLASPDYADRPQALLDAIRSVAENALAGRRSIIYLDEPPSPEELRAESEELAAILNRIDLDAIAGIKDLGGYVARLARLVNHLVRRSSSTHEAG